MGGCGQRVEVDHGWEMREVQAWRSLTRWGEGFGWKGTWMSRSMAVI